MKNKRYVFYGLAIILAGLSYFAVRAQQINNTPAAKFAGEWKAKESISMGGNIVCSFNAGDRMLAKSMKIAGEANALTVKFASAFASEPPVKGQENFTFDGKTHEVDTGHGKGKKYAVKLSPDGQTLTVNSVVHFSAPAPYNAKVLKQTLVNVTEVWKLSADGKSITVETKANANDNTFKDERNWKTVFTKVG